MAIYSIENNELQGIEIPDKKRSGERFFGLWKLTAFPMLLFIALPLLALFLRVSPATLLENISKTQILNALQVSFSSALISTILAIILGMPVALLLSRKKGDVFRIVDTLIDLPTVLPPAVAGIALLMTFGRNGLVGVYLSDWGITIPFTRVAVIMAQLFVAGPLFVRAASIGLSAVDPELKQAAALDGANRWQTFSMVIVPMAWTSIVSGAVMTWARALGEFGATIIFAGNFPGRTQTMPLAIYLGFETDMNIALVLSVILIIISFLSMIVVKGVLHKHVRYY
ncbi:MAG: molybdate ABC transporter permease subunit [Chloroflexi bacterium HGW-Chloroflexi-8]|nr:MAG: molybdate ABC transporter permease subunit [Chloroflexi bacterium HGW-Chloroflexi-8]